MDGPALNDQGVVLDLENGRAIFFSHSKELSSGFEYKLRQRALALAQRAEKVWQAMQGVDFGTVCSIDSTGFIYGADALSLAQADTSQHAERLKKFHRRQHLLSSFAKDFGSLRHYTLCMDQDGCVISAARKDVLKRFVVDENGHIHSFKDAEEPFWTNRLQNRNVDRLRRIHQKLLAVRRKDQDLTTATTACVLPNGSVSWLLPSQMASDTYPNEVPSIRPPCCRIDPEGHVHDVAGLSPPLSPEHSHHLADRLKLFHRKKNSRMHPSPKMTAGPWNLNFETDGELFWTLDEADCGAGHLHSGATTPTTMEPLFERTCSVDSEGIVHVIAPRGGLERTCSVDSEGVIHHADVRSSPSAERLKRFFRKRLARDGHADSHHIVASLDDRGIVQGWREIEEEPLIVPVNADYAD
jgi:hypothetical protein